MTNLRAAASAHSHAQLERHANGDYVTDFSLEGFLAGAAHVLRSSEMRQVRADYETLLSCVGSFADEQRFNGTDRTLGEIRRTLALLDQLAGGEGA